MMTIYDTLIHFFSTNPKLQLTYAEICKKFPKINKNSIHTNLVSLSRENKIIYVRPRKWKWNVNHHEI